MTGDVRVERLAAAAVCAGVLDARVAGVEYGPEGRLSDEAADSFDVFDELRAQQHGGGFDPNDPEVRPGPRWLACGVACGSTVWHVQWAAVPRRLARERRLAVCLPA